MKNKTIGDCIDKVLTNKLLLIILIIPYVKPATELTGKFDILFDALKIISCIFVFLAYFFKNRKPSKIILYISLPQMVFVFSTIINRGEIWWTIVQSVSVMSLIMLFEMALKVNKKIALFSFGSVLLTMSLLTSLSMFIYYPNGMYVVKVMNYAEHNNFLWGFDNSSVFKIIPSIVISGIYFYKYKANLKIIIPIYLFIISAYIYVNSITAGFVLLILIITYLVLLISNKPLKCLNIKYTLTLIVVLFILFLVFNGSLDIIKILALKIKKGYSLNSRIMIWNESFKYIVQQPIFGYGFEFKDMIKQKFFYDHLHNIFLDVLYRGGIAAFTAYVISIISIVKNNKKITLCYNMAAIGITCVVLCGLMDYYNDQYLMYLLLVVGFYAVYVDSAKNIFPKKRNR